MPLPRFWTTPPLSNPPNGNSIAAVSSSIPPFPSSNLAPRRPYFRSQFRLPMEEDMTEIVYFRLIWVCAVLSAFAFFCAAVFSFQLLRTPNEIADQMERNLAHCETSISLLQSNITQIHARVHRLGRGCRKIPSSSISQQNNRTTTSSQMVIPLWDADGTFCCIPGPPVPGRPGQPGQQGLPGKPGKMNSNDAILAAAFGMCGRQMKMEEKEEAKIIGEEECPQSCSAGQQGPMGLKGPKGDKGPPGEPGERGRNGLIGQCGPKGAKGPRGPPGKPGERGNVGISHSQQGEPGPIGLPGNAGPMGAPGLRGATRIGQKGQKGARGQPGSIGTQGLLGRVGPQGMPGLPGLCPRKCEFPVANAGVVIGGGGKVMEDGRKLAEEERELAEFAEYEQKLGGQEDEEGKMHDEVEVEMWTTRIEKEEDNAIKFKSME